MAAAGFGVVAAFQLGLALGAPWGRAALGSYNDGTLPSELRVASAVSITLFCWSGMRCTGPRAIGATVLAGLPRGNWALVAYLAFGVLLKLASSSPWERFGWPRWPHSTNSLGERR